MHTDIRNKEQRHWSPLARTSATWGHAGAANFRLGTNLSLRTGHRCKLLPPRRLPEIKRKKNWPSVHLCAGISIWERGIWSVVSVSLCFSYPTKAEKVHLNYVCEYTPGATLPPTTHITDARSGEKQPAKGWGQKLLSAWHASSLFLGGGAAAGAETHRALERVVDPPLHTGSTGYT